MLDARLKFIGKNESMGFINGLYYELKLVVERNKLVMTYPRYCPYGSLEAFMKNWSIN